MAEVLKQRNMPKFKPNTSSAMKRSAFKMAGYTYPGKSPVKNEELEKITKTSKRRGYGDSDITKEYDVFVSKRTKSLIDANAPKEVIEKSKNRDLEEFKARS